MSSRLYLILIGFFFFSLVGICQTARIYEVKMAMKTYPFSDPDPVPDMDKNYPYFKYDGFTNKSSQQEWNMVVLENDYIKVFVNTDVGGKIWGAIEKGTGGEFLYYNEVVKFRDVAHRGPWTSGGLEFNYGVMGHTSTCATPQDYVTVENEDGSVSCIIGAIDLHTQTKWNVEIKLQKDKAYIETISSCFNTGNLPVPFYHYSNAAAKAKGDLEFIFPGSHHIGHEGQVGTWPIDEGRNISMYRNNDFGGPKSYHIVNSISDYMGGYYHEEDFGFGNVHEYGKMPGRKLWIWGLSDEGMIWEDLLTDTDGQYIEFQTGSTFNQAMEGSIYSPFKNREFNPYDSDISTEIYFPLKKTGGMVKANRNAVLNIVHVNDSTIEIRLSALAHLGANLVLRSKNGIIGSSVLNLEPLDLFAKKFQVGKEKDFEIEVGNTILKYSSKNGNDLVDRPVHGNKDFDWNSAAGLFTKGLEAERQYTFIKGGHPRRVAQELYLKCLEKDPAYAPALNRVAFNYYRRMEYGKAIDYIRKALAINTYDAEANYLFGIVNVETGELGNAKSGFYIAAQSIAYRSAAHTELAKLFVRENELEKAMSEVDKALEFNGSNMVALEIKSVIFRLLNKTDMARITLEQIKRLDQTSSFVVNEQRLLEIGEVRSLSALITNELKAESYIDLALKYRHLGRFKESISVLKASPEDAKVFLFLAHFDNPNRNVWLEKALQLSPRLVFPFRTELYVALKELMALSGDWKLKYYTSLILWNKELIDQAKELIMQCGDTPTYAPFYLAKANLFSAEAPMVISSLERAMELAPNDWRVRLAHIDFLMGEKKYMEASKIAKKSFAINQENSVMGIRYADAMLKSGQFAQSLAFLEELEIIPFEGAVEGRKIYHESAIQLSYEALKKGRYNSAVHYVEKAKLWPKNLGAGKPYNADERLENAILAYSYDKIGKHELASKYRKKIIDYKLDTDDRQDPRLYLQILALQSVGEKEKSRMLLHEADNNDPHNKYIQWIKKVMNGEDPALGKTGKLRMTDIENPLDDPFLLVVRFLDIVNSK